MAPTLPTVLALDFDGVICDGLQEYFQTAWRAYCALWEPAEATPPEGLAASFYLLRPVVETGWEMPLLLRALVLGISEVEILHNWGTIAPELAQKEGMEAARLGATVDGIRDQWIASDLESWLAEHRFYPGVIDRLQSILNSSTRPVIISTKEGRFIRQLLQQQGIAVDAMQIIGKETRRPKYEVLRQLLGEYGGTFWFVEDRLKTLDSVRQHADLAQVTLFLADWGYNTQPERDQAAQAEDIYLLSLPQFAQEFAAWVEKA